MLYEKELKLLCDTFKKCRVHTAVVSPLEPLNAAIDPTIRDVVLGMPSKQQTVHSFVGNLEPKTMYKFTDEFNLCYTYLPIEVGAEASLLFVGPYLSSGVSHTTLLELGERLNIPPKEQNYFEEIYAGIPVLSEGDPLFVMLDTFCEQIWDQPSFAICDVNAPDSVTSLPLGANTVNDSIDDTLLNIKAMETRYKFENELIQAVVHGQLHKEKLLVSSFSEKLFEKRAQDPLRNAKNYGIIMNTLLRKAAEEGGVHPVYIDKMSSSFALKIEQMSSLSQNTALMKEMFRSYCKLVRKHSVQKYSLTVQKTILIIDNDLSADLSLSALAAQQNISCAYLSSLFKKETGKTVSEYIREKRMQYAERLLSTTHLQVQTVALHCGVMDVQYFSKLFKKHTGKTPKEYREAAREQ
ncbi:MAG: helix-turn-helix domain-containing protein [Ruminococcaceae bacterium]|nr:helix-turn-helix domain-containing protein [Oscillospiraceae bacterium]